MEWQKCGNSYGGNNILQKMPHLESEKSLRILSKNPLPPPIKKAMQSPRCGQHR